MNYEAFSLVSREFGNIGAFCLEKEKMADQPKKQISPFSLRFTFEERAQLEKDAAGMSLGAYIRSRIFDENLPKRRTRGKHPVKDHCSGQEWQHYEF